MERFIKHMTVLFALLGGFLFTMTPFAIVRYWHINGTYAEGAIQTIVMSITAILFWPISFAVGALCILSLIIGSVVVICTPGSTDKLYRYWCKIVQYELKLYSSSEGD